MKCRFSLVSNSSSSSFVIIGYKIPTSKMEHFLMEKMGKTEDDFDRGMEEVITSIVKGINVLTDDDSVYIGKMLGQSYSDGEPLPDKNITFGELKKMSADIHAALMTSPQMFDVLEMDEEPELIMGTRSC